MHFLHSSHWMFSLFCSLFFLCFDLLCFCYYFIFLGETSSGKSSIINAILGKNILPTGITATTTRVCRIKPSENLMIITFDANYKELEVKPFSDTQEMADELEKLAQTNNPEIGYVDILMPDLHFQQVQYAK